MPATTQWRNAATRFVAGNKTIGMQCGSREQLATPFAQTSKEKMIKVLSIKGKRNFDNPEVTPDLHWVELIFENEFGTHTLELNGERPLPEDPALRRDLEWLLWDYGLLQQQDIRTAKQRVRIVQNKFDYGDRNYPLAWAYIGTMGSPAGR